MVDKKFESLTDYNVDIDKRTKKIQKRLNGTKNGIALSVPLTDTLGSVSLAKISEIINTGIDAGLDGTLQAAGGKITILFDRSIDHDEILDHIGSLETNYTAAEPSNPKEHLAWERANKAKTDAEAKAEAKAKDDAKAEAKAKAEAEAKQNTSAGNKTEVAKPSN